jgi:hypothetical protein
VVDQNVAHGLGCDSPEMRTVLELLRASYKAEIQFVYEFGGLQCVVRAFPAETGSREATEFGMDEAHQLGFGIPVSRAHGLEQTSDVARRRVHGEAL